MSKTKEETNLSAEDKVTGGFSATPGLDIDSEPISIEVIDSMEDLNVDPAVKTETKVTKTSSKKPKEDDDIQTDDDKINVQNIESLDDIDEDLDPDEFEKIDNDDTAKTVVSKDIKKPNQDEKISPLKVFAQMLGDKGIIDFEDDKFEDTDDYLFNKVVDQIKGGIDSYKESLPPKVKEIIDNYEDGVPLQSFLEREATIDDYKAYDDKKIEENELLQKSLLRNYYSLKGVNDTKAENKLKRLEETGTLADEAKDARDEIVEILESEKKLEAEQVKLQRQERAKDYNNWLTGLKKEIDTRQEVIPGFKLTDKQKEKLYNGITKFDNEGKNEVMKAREKDPDFDIKVAYLATVLNWDFTAFEKKANSKTAKSLREMLDTDRFSSGGSSSRTESKNSKLDVNVMRNALNNLGK